MGFMIDYTRTMTDAERNICEFFRAAADTNADPALKMKLREFLASDTYRNLRARGILKHWSDE